MKNSNNAKRVIIDVREPSEYSFDHVEGAINVPPSELLAGAKVLKQIDKNTEIVLYCISGSRSNSAMHILRGLGYNNLINGINASHVTKNYL